MSTLLERFVEAREAHLDRTRPSPGQRVMAALDRERTLSDRLAAALRAVRSDRPSAHSDAVWAGVLSALAAYDESRE